MEPVAVALEQSCGSQTHKSTGRGCGVTTKEGRGRGIPKFSQVVEGRSPSPDPPPQWFDSVPLEGDVPGFDLPQEDFWNVSAQYMEQRGEIVACFDISIAELISGQPMRTCACLGGANI